MKRILFFALVLAMCVVCGCTKKEESKEVTKQPIKEEKESAEIKNETDENKDAEEKNQESVTQTKPQENNTQTNDKKTDTSSKQEGNQTSTTPKQEQTTPAIEEPTITEPMVVEEPTDTPMGETEEGVLCYVYAINGRATDWFVENELVHIVFTQVNRYAVFNTDTGEISTDKPLNGRPGEIHKHGDEIWISFPDLQCVKVYDAKTFTEQRSIYVKTSICSFDVSGDYLFFAEDDQHVQVYRYNMKTEEIKNFGPTDWATFYEANVLVNEKYGVVYIGESGSTGSAVYCYDMETMELCSKYVKDNYGYNNWKRRMYLYEDALYWGQFKLNAQNVSRVEAQYTGRNSNSMMHVDNYFVVTSGGIFLRDTCEHLVEANFNSIYCIAAITNTGNILLTEEGRLYIIPEKE